MPAIVTAGPTRRAGGPARDGGPPICDDDRVQNAVLEYFAGEKGAGLLVALVGALALAAAVVLFQPRWELRPLAIVLGVMGLLELGVGLGLVVRTGPQVERLTALLGADAPRFLAEESARMARVQATFTVLAYTWSALILLSVGAAFTQKGRPAIWSASLGVLLHAAFFLVFDQVAERRGAAYLRALTDQTGVIGSAPGVKP